MPKINLDQNAKFLLTTLQHQTQALSRDVEQKIGAACEAKQGAPLTAKELSQVLVDAMPDRKQAIQTAEKSCAKSGYHADGKKADFLTQFVGLHSIEKEVAVAVRPRQPQVSLRPTRDPLEAKFVLDNEAQSMLLFNGRDVDAKGQPLLMKAVLRVTDPSNADLTKQEVEAFKAKMGNFEGMRTQWGAGATDADIHIVAKNDAYVEIKDLQEREFNFGDPLLQLSQNAEGKEISRGVAVNPDNRQVRNYYAANADNTPNLAQPVARNWNSGPTNEVLTGKDLDNSLPMVYDDRIQLVLSAKADFPEGGWLGTNIKHLDAELLVQPGLIFEPNKNATVQFMGASAQTGVAADDAFFMGSPSASVKLDTASANFNGWNIRTLLTQGVSRTVTSGAGGSTADTAATNVPAYNLIFQNPERYNIGGKVFEPLGDVLLKKSELGASSGVTATLTPMDNPKGTNIAIDLAEGFAKATEGKSLAGWKVVVGFVDHDGAWKQCKEEVFGKKDSSPALNFKLGTENVPELMKTGSAMEIRLFNENGVPAERVKVPFQAMTWDKTAVAGDGGDSGVQKA